MFPYQVLTNVNEKYDIRHLGAKKSKNINADIISFYIYNKLNTSNRHISHAYFL